MDTNTTPTGTTLVKKLAAVMKEIGRIPKNGTNNFHGYKFVMESDLVEAVRDKLAERSIFVTPSVKGVEVIELSKPNKNGEMLTQKIGILHLEYTFRDGDSGETITVNGVGEIDQDGGKGLYKAMTGALKYMLMKNFLIATGDDPEHDGGQKKQATAAARPVAPSGTPPQSSAPRGMPAQQKPEEKTPEWATPAQVNCIENMAAKICIDVENDLYKPRGIAQKPTKSQASAIITHLKTLKAPARKSSPSRA